MSDHTIEHFLDKNDGSFYFTADYSENLLVRSKDVYDGAIPSGNSVSAYNFIRLGRILSRIDYEEISHTLLSRYSNRLNKSGGNQTLMMKAVDFIKGPSHEVLIFGDINDNSTKEMISAIHQTKQPNKVVVFISAERRNSLEGMMPYISYFPEHKDLGPIVYVCENYSCKLPTSDIFAVSKMLDY